MTATARSLAVDKMQALPDVGFGELAFQLRLLARSEATTAANMEYFIATLDPSLTMELRRLLRSQQEQARRVGLCVEFCEAIASREADVRALFREVE